MMPVRSLYIRDHICAEITKGKAHGTRIEARTRPRPGNVPLMSRAIPRPKIVSKVTAMRVKMSVVLIELRNSLLANS